jgi:hypothetical protein
MADLAVGPSSPPRRVPPPGERTRGGARAVKLTFGAGILVLSLLVALTLTQAPPRVLRAGPKASSELANTTGDGIVCQGGEVLPVGASAIRLSVIAFIGARVRVTVSSGAHVIAEGAHGPDWSGTSVTVPIKPARQTVANAKVCVYIGPNSQPIYILGSPSAPQEAAENGFGRLLDGRLQAEYLAPGDGSWWSRILTVARHMGLGHALTGTWVVLLIAALVASALLLAMWTALRELPSKNGRTQRRDRAPAARPRRRIPVLLGPLRRIPTAAWVCALIALLNASAWSLIVPPFQGKDEADHFAYVVDLVENQTLPEGGNQDGVYSAQQNLVLEALHYPGMVHSPQTPAISSLAEQRVLTRDLSAGESTLGSGEAGIATAEPPLYYAIQAIPYVIAKGNILDQLQLMRLVGALFAAITALCTFLFLREVLPRAPWAATVGALCVALQPLFAFMSGSVNPDSMLIAVAAAVFLCLARAFRRGLTGRRAVALGVLIAVGFLTKLNFIGFAVGVYLGLIVLGVREARARGPRALFSPALAGVIGLLPVGAYVLRNLLFSHPTLGIVSGTGTPSSLPNELSYIWEMYLPRLPGMTNYFKGILSYKDIWFDRSVGFYGWMDTLFPAWVTNVALVPAAAIVLLFAGGLFAARGALRRHLAELVVYATVVVGVLAMIAASSYMSVLSKEVPFGEPRYLLPLLPLVGAAITLAVRGAGRKWAPVVGAALVILFFGHDLFSQLQVIARYYG